MNTNYFENALINIERRLNNIRRNIDPITKYEFEDLTDNETYLKHANIVMKCGEVILSKENKEFVINDGNRKAFRFLLLYFNNCPMALEVYKEKNCKYSLRKNILLTGQVGVGKTIMMDIFSLYLNLTKNPNAFTTASVAELINYYKIHNHLDRYTFNSINGKNNSYTPEPENICLNDVGVQTAKHFGENSKQIVSDFMIARSEIWTKYNKCCHITTNLRYEELMKEFTDEAGRMADRLKLYNIINMDGKSMR